MDDDARNKLRHVRREHAGPIARDLDLVETGDATVPTVPGPDFDQLFDADTRELAARLLRIALAVSGDVRLPDDADTRLAILTDLQRLCVATEAEIDRRKRDVEDEIVERVRVERRRARRRDGR